MNTEPNQGEWWYYKLYGHVYHVYHGKITEISDKIVRFGGCPKGEKYRFWKSYTPEWIYARNKIQFIEKREE